MKFAIINPIDNSVHEIRDAMSASDIHLDISAPYLVHAAEDTAVGDIYDPESASFSVPEVEPPIKSAAHKAKAEPSASARPSSGK
jgi:hypothetical protein